MFIILGITLMCWCSFFDLLVLNYKLKKEC